MSNSDTTGRVYVSRRGLGDSRYVKMLLSGSSSDVMSAIKETSWAVIPAQEVSFIAVNGFLQEAFDSLDTDVPSSVGWSS